MKQPTPQPKRSRLAWLKEKADKRLLKLLLWQLVTAIITGLIVWRVFVWYQTNTIVFHSPIKIEWFAPIRLVNRLDYHQEVETTKTLAEIKEKALYNYQHPETLPKCDSSSMQQIDPQKFWDIIWDHESTSGKNNTVGSLAWKCEQKGGWNEIGYSPSTGFCFHSKEEAQLFIPFYVSKNGYGKTLNELLCFYNTGTYSISCPYSDNNLSLAN
jgi:hypothetical protein